MKSPFGLLFPTLAGGAALFAIATETHYSVALSAAVIAVIAGGGAVWEAARRSPKARATRPSPPTGPETVGVRSWLGRGRLGRAEIIHLVDRLDRAGDRPQLPVRSTEEVAVLVDLPDAEFRAYLNARLDRIEGDA
jgi:hypothetical protein